MAWEIIFYQTPRGEEIVKKFLETEGEPLMGKASYKIRLLQDYGPLLGMPHAKKLEGKLYELRVRGKDEVRIIYTFIENKVCLLHSFKKKTQEIPEKELEIARQRLKALTEL